MIEATFLKAWMLISQEYPKKVLYLSTVFLIKRLMFQANVCNGSHGILMVSIDINSITILDIYGVNYHCFIVGIIKREAINLLRNADLGRRNLSI